jgi:hypothetical protein
MCEQDGRDGDKSFFGLVRWQSVRVVPLDWLEDAHSLKRENLPIRCRCKWGPADQVVELMEISDSKNELDEKLSKGYETDMVTNDGDGKVRRTSTTVTTTTLSEENGKVRKREYSQEQTTPTTDAKRVHIHTEQGANSPYQSPVQTLINVGYGFDSSKDYPETNGTDSEYKQKLLNLTKQVEMERQQKLEMVGMIQQLTSEVNMKKIELKEAKLRLQILESFPRPSENQLTFLSELLSFYSHTPKQVATAKTKSNRSLSDASEKMESPRDNGVHTTSDQVRLLNRSVIVSGNNKHGMDASHHQQHQQHQQQSQAAVVPSGITKVTEVTGIPSTDGCYILAPTTVFAPHAIRMVTMPRINSPGGSSNGSKDVDEEAGSIESSELGTQGTDLYGTPYGRNGYSSLVTQDEKLQEEEAFKPGPNVSACFF